jgi:hypothetical protein
MVAEVIGKRVFFFVGRAGHHSAWFILQCSALVCREYLNTPSGYNDREIALIISRVMSLLLEVLYSFITRIVFQHRLSTVSC